MLNEVKLALRISKENNQFDTELTDLISAARNDLITAGVKSEIANSDSNILAKQAIIFYCKATFGFDNQDAGRFNNLYIDKKNTLAMYGGEADEI
ncbi:head-tail connector protein [Companilactobacillus metriopterae]|uniref:head-tail connector protein n=1 Tax=Companilactobacillus metriopterae TaxID=1909267 RepID=UPI00100B1C5D|nr:head-tail connector protein [Companilactobacillus metriopterae]